MNFCNLCGQETNLTSHQCPVKHTGHIMDMIMGAIDRNIMSADKPAKIIDFVERRLQPRMVPDDEMTLDLALHQVWASANELLMNYHKIPASRKYEVSKTCDDTIALLMNLKARVDQ